MVRLSNEKKGHQETYQHFLVLGNSNTLSLDDLHIVETTEDLVLHLELGRHGELNPLLDLERVVLQGLLRAGGSEVNRDRRTAFRVHRQGQDDALARVVRVRDALATTSKSQGFLITL
jgi:hypothetical protein